jgi:hypothetical protein
MCGKFRGAAHSHCSLEYKTQRNVPVPFKLYPLGQMHAIVVEQLTAADIFRIVVVGSIVGWDI